MSHNAYPQNSSCYFSFEILNIKFFKIIVQLSYNNYIPRFDTKFCIKIRDLTRLVLQLSHKLQHCSSYKEEDFLNIFPFFFLAKHFSWGTRIGSGSQFRIFTIYTLCIFNVNIWISGAVVIEKRFLKTHTLFSLFRYCM